MGGFEFEDFDDGADDEADFQLPQKLAGADAGPVAEAEMQAVFRRDAFFRQDVPALRREGGGGMAGHRFAPEFLAAVGVPHVEADVGSFGDHHFAVVLGLDPGIDRGAAGQEIERGGEAQGFFQDPVEGFGLREVFGIVGIHVFDFVVDLVLQVGPPRQVRNGPAGEGSGRFQRAGEEDPDVAAQGLVGGVGFELAPQAEAVLASGEGDVSERLEVGPLAFVVRIFVGGEAVQGVEPGGDNVDDHCVDQAHDGRDVTVAQIVAGNLPAEEIVDQHLEHHDLNLRLQRDAVDLAPALLLKRAQCGKAFADGLAEGLFEFVKFLGLKQRAVAQGFRGEFLLPSPERAVGVEQGILAGGARDADCGGGVPVELARRVAGGRQDGLDDSRLARQ